MPERLSYSSQHAIMPWIGLICSIVLLNPYHGSANETNGPNTTVAALDLDAEYRLQYAELLNQLERRDTLTALAGQAQRADAVIQPGDRDPVDIVLRRTEALLNHGIASFSQVDYSDCGNQLERIKSRLHTLESQSHERREQIYMELCRLRRTIAFRNPLLNFDSILFVKHFRSIAPDEHMCDQYYGCFAKAGGGLYVLENAFSDHPVVRNVLANRVVEKGRLAYQTLTPGSFLSPDLSYDAKQIVFAYSETLPEGEKWSPGRSFHLFKVNVDGSQLVQLTDGPWNDMHPCWLPTGRIAFISERRGGYLRCGLRPCPTYTLHSVNPDGSDIVPLSYHETHEWHPSITHDGTIVYTRWDYVDRDTNVAHHPWVTTPDGRDARAIQGNYPTKRQGRPWMEMNIRAIPNSLKFVATAAPHHGQAYGSFVLIDPTIEDDDAMGPLRRLTPEVPFPEAETGKGKIRAAEVYATAWPLSEDFYLAAYDPRAENYGIYLLDAFGNKELLYRDKEIPCLSPMPMQARRKPPIVPHRTAVGFPPGTTPPSMSKRETIALINVYDSRFAWPEGTTIDALRIIQVLPKTTPSNNVPRIGVAEQTNARAVLGTVPVESDGSAYFEAPVGTPIYFQALDERGLAIQSMRSAAYVQPGEQLVCQGCHERRHHSPPNLKSVLALQRPPSPITSDVEGSNPFNYPRLVQPVLDRHCVPCHRDNPKAPNLSGEIEQNGWSISYLSLAKKYGFYYNVFNGSFNDPAPAGGARTLPRQFGALASPLYQLLSKGHHNVNLSKEDWHRITLWLDCNSEFYGAYERTEAQSRGEIVLPTLQ